ncbi:MAG: Nucleoid-associated protein [Chlamydiia bacterium]|nr:Nucleoid-associated protein [Chlamydiia bacterium]MCH9616098.1 Nucleoid-associated protein [Chlamydiia bacterium]MCH9629479.1 Nucleoid-associated protein [Chlamydiia bacterium]
MGSGFSKMKKQARQMQEQFEQMQDELSKKRVTGTAGGDLVKMTLNGDKDIIDLEIKKECVDPEDIEGLQDLIIGAYQNATSQLQEEMPALPFGM